MAGLRGAQIMSAVRSFAGNSAKVAGLGVGGLAVGAGWASLFGSGAGPDPYAGKNVNFPNDLDMNDNYIEFIAKSTAGVFSTTITGGKMRLPLPAGLSTDYHLAYKDESLGAAAGTALKTADRGLYGNTDIPAGAAVGGMIAGAGADLVKNAIGDAGKSLAGVGDAALKTSTGLAQNPNKIVLFTGVDFRNHSFSWNLSPRNREESNKIRTIIDMFTYYSHPEFITGGLFFKYPEFFEISFRRDAYLFKIRPSVCKGIKVNYHPHSYASYVRNADGTGDPAPSEISFSLNFQETEIISKSFLNPHQDEVFKKVSSEELDQKRRELSGGPDGNPNSVGNRLRGRTVP
jgi:hypothetical protein